MASIVLAVVCLLLGRSRAVPVDYPIAAHGDCIEFDLPIYTSSHGAVYDILRVDDDLSAAAWAIQSDTRTSPKGFQSVVQNTTITGTYNIHAQLCVPKSSAGKANVLQIATHGIFYDHHYWDVAINQGNSSYVKAALAAGYSIFAYDRLGVGQSEKPDAYDVVQAPFELEILHQLTLMARNGSLYSAAKQSTTAHPGFQSLTRPEKVVHVGHSFGSLLTFAYIAKFSSLSDGAIITGFLPGSAAAAAYTIFGAHFAPTYSSKYADRGKGYVVPDKVGVQNVFFGGDIKTAFTQKQLDYGDHIKQPASVAEFSSGGTLVTDPVSTFEGPVQYMLPENDFFFCAGDCKGLLNETTLRKLYPNASALEVYIQPNTGHALPLHNNATAGYQAIFDFLGRNSL